METLFNNGKSLTNPQRYPNPNETNEMALSTNQPNASVHSLVVDSDQKEKIYIYILYLLYLFHSSRHSMMPFLYSVPIDNEPPLVHGNITEKLVMFFCFVLFCVLTVWTALTSCYTRTHTATNNVFFCSHCPIRTTIIIMFK